MERIPKIIQYIEIGKNYEITGKDYTMKITPTNATSIPSSTHVNFSKCENILRNHYNISNSRIITFLQVEIENNNEKSIVNQVEYQAYDDNKNKLNLNICNDTDIEVIYSMKKDSSIDLLALNSFKDLDIDLLNIKDRFFTDICMPYSKSDDDVILIDRIIDFYQNYSLCDNNCVYNEIDLELMVISCNCSVKTNISVDDPILKLEQLKDIEKSMAFEIVKCYNLVFSLKNKMNNIGFWILLIFVTAHIPLFFIYLIKGIKTIKKYIFEEMKKNGYIKENEYNILNEEKNVESKKKKRKSSTNIIRRNTSKMNTAKIKGSKNNDKWHNISKEKKNLNYPPKKTNKKNIKNMNTTDKNKLISLNKSNLIVSNSSAERNLNIEGKNTGKQNTKNKPKKNKEKNKDFIIKVRSRKKSKTEKIRKKKNLSFIPTLGTAHKEKKNNQIKKEKSNIINLNLININLNTRNNNRDAIPKSDFILNIYTFEEAIKNDLRSVCKIFYIYLLTKQSIFHAFLYKSPIVLFPLRLTLLIFIISSDLALNSIFYFDDKISEKYRYAKNIFLFALNKNMTVILLSTFIGFVLLTLFTKFSNSTNVLREVFKKEEEKMKANKKYIVTDKRKKEIVKEIEKILKNYKIKIYIFMFIEFFMMIFYWYYVTVFCHVYNSTQRSWLVDSFLTMLSRIIIDFLLCLGFAKLYRIAVEANVQVLYKVSLFFYSFC